MRAGTAAHHRRVLAGGLSQLGAEMSAGTAAPPQTRPSWGSGGTGAGKNLLDFLGHFSPGVWNGSKNTRNYVPPCGELEFIHF